MNTGLGVYDPGSSSEGRYILGAGNNVKSAYSNLKSTENQAWNKQKGVVSKINEITPFLRDPRILAALREKAWILGSEDK